MPKVPCRPPTAVWIIICLGILLAGAFWLTQTLQPSETEPASVRFVISLEPSSVVLPNAVFLEIRGFSGTANSPAVAHHPWRVRLQNSLPVLRQTIQLDDVPLDTKRFQIDFLDQKENVVGCWNTETVDLRADTPTEVTVGHVRAPKEVYPEDSQRQ